MPFHNPYNFVRTPARSDKVLCSPFAGDYDPSKPERRENFSRYWPERYSGEISVRLRTATPLFITDPRTKTPSQVTDHYIYDCMAEIPATALKGMLSSAYEIITNSRYRVFSEKQHSKRLGFRYQANASLVPGRVRESGGKFTVTLFTGTSRIGHDKADGPLYAAWLPAYRGGHCIIPAEIHNAMYCENVELGLYSYSRGGRFKLWCVKSIGGKQFQPISRNISANCEQTIRADGYIVISGKTINRKHDERFFFNESGKNPVELPISDPVRKRYEDLIADYQRTHEIINGREQNPVNDPNDEGIIFGSHIDDPSMLDLRDGDFVYVKTDGTKAEALYPVQISRELHEASVWDCLDKSLKPANDISQLSPADRLFGWISQSGSGSWKGKIQITSAKYESSDGISDPVEHFDEPLTLDILGEPKPSQARFYLGKNDGSPQNNGIPKERASYSPGKHIRGRKVYLHHTLHFLKKDERGQYWDSFAQNGFRREKSNQNRSISGWIPPQKTFSFKIRVENLTSEELGALLILFSIDNECCFRLGYGKPLGFGSVRLSIDGDIEIATGQQLSERYRSITGTQKYRLSESEREKCIKAYQKAMAAAYSTVIFEDVKVPDVLRFSDDLYDLLNDGQKKTLHEVWLSALDRDQDTAPTDELPEKETLTELFTEEYFDEKYKEDLRNWREYRKQSRKNDYGWRKLDFIKSFIDSMKGFTEPVMYPVSRKGNEGFQWFAENERTADGKCTGYSLPEMGKTLEEL